MAKTVVAARVAVLIQLIVPASAIVLARRRVITAEQTLFEAVAVADDQRGVGKGAHVLLLDLIVLQQIVDDPHQEHHVAARAYRRIEVRHRGGAVEARIHDNHLRVIAFLRLYYPFKADRVRFCRIAAHDQHHVGVFDVVPVIGHRASAEAGRQRGDRRAVAQPGLVLQRDDAERAGEFMVEQAGFITGGRRAEHGGGRPAVDRNACGVGLLEVSIAILLHQAGDALKGLLPADALPFVTAWRAILRIFQPLVAVNVVEHASAFGAERAAADRMIRIAFYMVDSGAGIFSAVAEAVDQHAAADGTVSAVIARLSGANELIFPGAG